MAGSYYSDSTELFLDAQRLVELTDSAAAPGVVNQTVIDRASRKAERLINMKLRGRYIVPFAQGQVPDEIAELHADLTRYFLFAYRDSMNIPAAVAEEFKMATADLDDYADANGGLMLDAPLRAATDATPGGGGGAISTSATDPALPPRIFGREGLT